MEDVKLTGNIRGIEFAINLVLFAILDILIDQVSPKLFYGTNNIEPYPAFIKYCALMVALTFMGTPFRIFLHKKLVKVTNTD